MIVFGHRSTQLGVLNLFNVPCPSCEQKSTTEMYVFSKYAHVFWIPFFTMDKIGVSQCGHCKAVLTESKMNPELKEELKAMKAGLKVHKWQFTGLALVVTLLTVGLVNESIDSGNNKKYIADPQVGDKYHYKTDTNYSIEKVVSVTADSIELELNQMEYSKSYGLEKIDRPENYVGYTEMYSKKDIQQQFKVNVIYVLKIMLPKAQQ